MTLNDIIDAICKICQHSQILFLLYKSKKNIHMHNPLIHCQKETSFLNVIIAVFPSPRAEVKAKWFAEEHFLSTFGDFPSIFLMLEGGRLHSTNLQSNMYGDKKIITRRFISLAVFLMLRDQSLAVKSGS